MLPFKKTPGFDDTRFNIKTRPLPTSAAERNVSLLCPSHWSLSAARRRKRPGPVLLRLSGHFRSEEDPGRLRSNTVVLEFSGRRREPRPQCGRPFLDDRLTPGQFLLPLSHIFPDDLFQVVNVVEVNVVDELHLRVDVPRDGDVDEEQRPTATDLHRGCDIAAAQNRLGRAGGTDHDVRVAQGIEAIVETDGP